MALAPIQITPSFKRRLKRKPESLQRAIAECVEQLRADWTHPGLRTHRVQGTSGVYEARIDGGNRLTFHWDGDVIVLRNHCNHDILNFP